MSISTTNSMAVVTDEHRAASSRSAPPTSPQPAAAAAAPARQNLRPALQRCVPRRSADLCACHVAKLATFHTHTDHTLLLTVSPASAEGPSHISRYPSLRGNQKPPRGNKKEN
eukprot:83496-Prymnesium_polylepis.1